MQCPGNERHGGNRYDRERVTVEEVPSGDVQGLVEAGKRLAHIAEEAIKTIEHVGAVEPDAHRADLADWQAELAKWETASSGEAKDAG
jgi:hypothetical protein